MNNEEFGIVKKAVTSAHELSALDATALWALFCMVLIIWIVWREKQSRETSDKWSDIRTEEAKADMLTAQALNKLADAINRQQIIIDERIPRRLT